MQTRISVDDTSKKEQKNNNSNAIKNLPNDIWKQKIVPFLSDHDQKALACVSKIFQSYIPPISIFSEGWKRNNRMWKIESELKKLNSFITCFEDEIAKKSFFDQRIDEKTIGILSALLILLGSHVFLDYILGTTVPQKARLESLLDSSFPSFNNHTCTEALRFRKELYWCLGNSHLPSSHQFNTLLSSCYDICEMIRPLNGSITGSAIGVAFLSIFIFFLIRILFAIDKGKNRFNSLSPNNFSSSMRFITKELLNQFRLNERNPFENVDLNNSIGEIIAIANATKIEDEREYKQLLDKKSSVANEQKAIEVLPLEEEKYFSKILYKKWNLFKKPAFLNPASVGLLSGEHKTFEPTSP